MTEAEDRQQAVEAVLTALLQELASRNPGLVAATARRLRAASGTDPVAAAAHDFLRGVSGRLEI